MGVVAESVWDVDVDNDAVSAAISCAAQVGPERIFHGRSAGVLCVQREDFMLLCNSILPKKKKVWFPPRTKNLAGC